MSPKQAADFLGCHPSYIRHLVSKGILEASKQPTENNQHGYVLVIAEETLVNFKRRERQETRGWKLGKKRLTKKANQAHVSSQ
jgi:hypothetical protein